MRNLFEHTSASWVRYSDYEWKSGKDGTEYLLPAVDADPRPYDPMKDAETLVLDAIAIGQRSIRKAPREELKAAIREFAGKYGLLGIMTALPTTARFIDYEKVYLPKNDFIRAESMDTEEYLRLFFPFATPDFVKQGVESRWNVEEKAMIALILTYGNAPQAQVMSFMRDYGERYEWLVSVFQDWAFTFMTVFFYYHDFDRLDADTKNIYQKGMAAFDGNAPTYHLELRESPTLVWDFHSLMMNIKMLFTMLLTDENHPMRMCKNCNKAFIARRKNEEFCSSACRSKYNAERKKSAE